MDVGIVRRVDIEQQMQEAYLDYAMSVIVSRALPDVRDGLKPVHRRILYAMHDMGLQPTKPYKKSARIVGEVLGKYHPHGDAAVYDTMVRMAQDFSMRVPLVDGQGNFGSVDGDAAAAMRYTEARLTALASELMVDIDKDTIGFVENFDGSLVEPDVLPAKAPNFLVNGAAGIAVGMATSVPPHNLGEVCDALIFMLAQQAQGIEVELDDLLQFIQGPDFPTGGIIFRQGKGKKSAEDAGDVIRSAYAVGRGRVTVQAKIHIEEMSRGRHRLVVTELPYQTNKANLVEKIADLARDGKIEGIADLRDESDRQGMRIVIELTRTVEPRQVLRHLLKMTPLQGTFSINMLGLVDNEPRLINLKRGLQLFVEHRQTIITRRTQYELTQAQNRAHILEGLRIALANLDDVIDIIRRSRTAETARKNLREKFSLSEVQAAAILDMPLRRLASMERTKIETEYKDLRKTIKDLETLLATPAKILSVIQDELRELKQNYATPRQTTIIDQPPDPDAPLTAADLVPQEEVIVAVSQQGIVCRWPVAQHFDPARNHNDDPLAVAVSASTRDALYLFTAGGKAAIVPMHQVPPGTGLGSGVPLTELNPGLTEPVVAGLAVNHDEGYVCLVAESGRVKRLALADLATHRGNEAVVMGLDKDDRLVTAFATPGTADIVLVTAMGQTIRFSEEEVRTMGLSAAGVMGIKLSKRDKVVGAALATPDKFLLVVTEKGVGKQTPLEEYPVQGRYGQGTLTLLLPGESGLVVTAAIVSETDRVMLISQRNDKVIYARSLPTHPRYHAGESMLYTRGRDQFIRVLHLPM